MSKNGISIANSLFMAASLVAFVGCSGDAEKKDGGSNAPVAVSAPAGTVASGNEPQLVKSYGRHNIIKFKEDFIIAPHGQAIDLTKDDPKTIQGIKIVKSENEAMDTITKIADDTHQPVLMETVKASNIVRYNGKFYVIPHSAGDVDLLKVQPNSVNGLKVVDTYSAAVGAAN